FASLFVFSFSFSCYLPHRDLHSFPTRRSSDLDGAALRSVTPPGFYLRVCTDALLLPAAVYCYPARRSIPSPNPPWAGRTARAHRDRKSTRLNSSHDQISYAVFCLKKKKKKTK